MYYVELKGMVSVRVCAGTKAGCAFDTVLPVICDLADVEHIMTLNIHH